jgi:hypothetical protein
MPPKDAATVSITSLGILELLLAMRMSYINGVQMKYIKNSILPPREAAAKFLQTTYYKSWSRAQLNNTEYAPMLALLMFFIKYKADKRKRSLTTLEKIGCYGSLLSTLIFTYAVSSQGKLNLSKIKPGSGGMSPLRPLGAVGRYVCMGILCYCAAATE